jgi:uncharacterized protein (DUF488 family)
MTGRLYSLGYARLRGVDDLRRLLADTEVDTVVDVRLRPWGRPPFNGPRATQLLVEAAGFLYIWDQRLGNRGYKSGTIEIADIEAIEDVIAMLRAGQGVAMMCVCADVAECHRQVLADEAARRLPGLRVVNL